MPDKLTAAAIVDAVLSGAMHPSEPLTIALRRAQELEHLHAFRLVDPDHAFRQVGELAKRIRSGERPPLAAVPVAIKDNIAQKEVPLRAGRRDGSYPSEPRDAVLVERLSAAGAIIVGRTNMDELAYGVTGSNPHTGQVIHPTCRDCHPGGSSAGSAVAVAAGIVVGAIGTDTAGSIRIPASLCGIFGFRPTQGLSPTSGVAPLAPSLDAVGPFARTSDDLARLLSVILDDPSLAAAATSPTTPLRLRAAFLTGPFAVEPLATVQEIMERSIDGLCRAGVEVGQKPCPCLTDAPRAIGPIIGAEAAHAWSAELDRHPERFGEEVSAHLKKGATMMAVRYLRAVQSREEISWQIDSLLREADLLILPTVAIGTTPWANPGPQLNFLALTSPASLSGHPACSIPVGSVNGSPVGMQLIARRNQEGLLLRVAARLEHVLQRGTCRELSVAPTSGC